MKNGVSCLALIEYIFKLNIKYKEIHQTWNTDKTNSTEKQLINQNIRSSAVKRIINQV